MIDKAHALECLRRIAQGINDLDARPLLGVTLSVAEECLPAFGEPVEVTSLNAGWQRVTAEVDGVRFQIDGPHYKLVYQGRAPL